MSGEFYFSLIAYRSSLTINEVKTDVKKLNPARAIMHRQGSFGLRLVHAVFALTISLFFRRIELAGSENLPEKSGLIFVLNHPNALIDPALVFVALPRRIAFLAKSTLFKIPVLAFLIRLVGALPLYRQQDAGADVSGNQKTFAIARRLLKKGGAIAIFPEGVSHNETKLQPLKTGAARIALGALSVEPNDEKGIDERENGDRFELKIVPVGLFYTSKTTFRSEALLHFGEPFDVLPVETGADGQPPPDRVKALTRQIENHLREATLNAESNAKLETARIAEKIFTSVTPHRENLAERLEILKKFAAETDGEAHRKLENKLAGYEKKLDEFGIEPEFLDLANYSKRFIVKAAAQRLWWLIVLAPFAVFGAVLHFPAYKICKFLAFLQTKKGDDDMASTVKVLAGLVLMPLTWLIWAAALGIYFGWQFFALLSVPFSFLCGYVALRSFEEIEELSGWLKAISIFFLKRERFLRLFAERQSLFEKMRARDNAGDE